MGITSVTLPNSLSGNGSIGANAFEGNKISTLNIGNNSNQYSSNSFANQNITAEMDRKASYTIGELLTKMGISIKDNNNKEQLTDEKTSFDFEGLPDGVTVSGDGWNSVITIPNTVKKLSGTLFVKNNSKSNFGGYSINLGNVSIKDATDPTDPTNPGGGNNGGGGPIVVDPEEEPVTPEEIDPGETVNFKHHYKLMVNKNIWRYRDVQMTKKVQRFSANGRKRVDRPTLTVVGAAKTAKGTLRYKVAQGGYVTANQKFVVNLYYQGTPKTIKVIGKSGLNSYKTSELFHKEKVKHYKKGTILKVKKIVSRHKITRYQLTNGKYISTNKQLIIWDKK